MTARLLVASTNPVKVAAAERGYRLAFPGTDCAVSGQSAPSGVSDQPMGDDETLLGAFNRATALRARQPQADYWLGIEGGCADTPRGMEVFAWVVVLGQANMGRARTGMFYLPEEVAALVRQGMELGHADDAVFGRENSKHSDGSVGLLTGGAIDRAAYYAHAVTLAFVPFLHPGLNFPASPGM